MNAIRCLLTCFRSSLSLQLQKSGTTLTQQKKFRGHHQLKESTKYNMFFFAKSLNMVMTCTHRLPLYGSTPSSRLHVLVAHATVIPSSPQLQGFTTPASRSCSFVGRQAWWRQKSCLHNYAVAGNQIANTKKIMEKLGNSLKRSCKL